MKPEYYKCINDGGWPNKFTLNKIYKINNPDDLEAGCNFKDNLGINNGWTMANYKHFEPSTKEEYFIQEGLILKQEQNYDYLVEFLTRNNIK